MGVLIITGASPHGMPVVNRVYSVRVCLCAPARVHTHRHVNV